MTTAKQVQPAVRNSASETSSERLLSVRDLKAYFPIRTGLLQRVTGHVKAVDGVSFEIGKGETLGLVGESGCGKTTVGRAILRLIPTTAGTVVFEGHDMLAARGAELKGLRRNMQIIFQDPASSLNPRMRIGTILAEPLLVHGLVTDKAELRERVASLLVRCGMPKAAADRYPHEFSGGQRQRIGIARALSLEPKFIVCDEPTSALDHDTGHVILRMLKNVALDDKKALVIVTHDSRIFGFADRIARMDDGHISDITSPATEPAASAH